MKKLITISIMALSLGACVTQEQVFCPDSDYTEALYLYLKDDPDLGEQKELMTDYIGTCESHNYKVSPGAYAHMGLLASKDGDVATAEAYFIKEKTLFPESAHYIDFLMKKKEDSSNSKDLASELKADGSSLSSVSTNSAAAEIESSSKEASASTVETAAQEK